MLILLGMNVLHGYRIALKVRFGLTWRALSLAVSFANPRRQRDGAYSLNLARRKSR